MSDEHKDPELQTWIDPELEARVVAWVLGEASEFEAAELARIIAEKPELGIFKRRIEAVHGLVAAASRMETDPMRLRRRTAAEAAGEAGRQGGWRRGGGGGDAARSGRRADGDSVEDGDRDRGVPDRCGAAREHFLTGVLGRADEERAHEEADGRERGRLCQSGGGSGGNDNISRQRPWKPPAPVETGRLAALDSLKAWGNRSEAQDKEVSDASQVQVTAGKLLGGCHASPARCVRHARSAICSC